MKKYIFSVLFIGTFVTYALFFQKSSQTAQTMPVALNDTQTVAPTAPVVADAVAPPEPPSIATSSSSPVVETPPTVTNDQLNLQARGQVHLVSTYASAVTLIKSTRLLTADGKLYRLAEAVTVPAYGQVTASVYADQNGSLYAIGPTTFSIPGLSASLQSYITASSNTTFVMGDPLIAATTPAQTTPTTPASAPVAVKALPPSTPPPAPKPLGMYRDGTYTGDVVDAYYGNVQIAAVIQSGKISNVQFLDYPQDRSHSVEINDYAMPILKQEAIQSQTANVNAVSGATATSEAFVQSLTSALTQAKN